MHPPVFIHRLLRHWQQTIKYVVFYQAIRPSCRPFFCCIYVLARYPENEFRDFTANWHKWFKANG